VSICREDEENAYLLDIKEWEYTLLVLTSKNFLARQSYINSEPFQRTDISMQPLGPDF
jgi:hypothetical protein